MPGLGHNKGPTLRLGRGWHRHAWTKARADLLPTLPLEVVRLRVKRAQDLGLPYRIYASVRAASGRDLVALLFSSNALQIMRPGEDLPSDRHAVLTALNGVRRLAMAQAPVTPSDFRDPIDAAYDAPTPWCTWADARAAMRHVLSEQNLPADAILTIGATHLEKEWAEAGRTAGYLPADRYFAPNTL